MRKIKLILSIIALSLPGIVSAQHFSSKRHKQTSYEDNWDFDNCIALKLTPTSVLDPYGSLAPVGLEYYFRNKYGVSLDVGIPLFYCINSKQYNDYKRINSDFKIRADFRQYFGFCRKNRFFAGAEVFYRYQNMDLQHSYFHFLDNMCYQFTNAKASKNIFGFGAIAGISHKFTNHFFLEGNIGIGLRIINMTPQWDINAAKPYFKGSFVSLELPNEDRVGDHDLNIYIPFAIKLSYLF